ncbi:hypothetical protein ASD52_31385 [Ensifer sp. Root142]|nr:hypothetical protein ASD52_31385 [Ensifer sp. Root142]OMQ42416.1 hypothetical protein BKP54_23935 [Ensifer sp. 1H6]PSS62861.1 hypothetical protein C6558_20785 [Ensifer sp. NM-2]
MKRPLGNERALSISDAARSVRTLSLSAALRAPEPFGRSALASHIFLGLDALRACDAWRVDAAISIG